MKLRWRVLLTFAVVFLHFGFLRQMHTVLAPVLGGYLAVGQLRDSDVGYIGSQMGLHVLSWLPILVALVTAALLFLIWYGPLKRWFSAVPAVLLALAVLSASTTPSFAYYDKKDWGEYVEIAPNWSAFLVPMTGANKANQAQFGSVDYLNSNKVPAKRVQIPHVKAEGTSYFTDFYIPGAKLYVVVRDPYNREWVRAGDRGTSNRDESFRFESADSLNVGTGIVIGASIHEQDAAKYLYYFGAWAIGDYSKPEVMFASVVYSRTLADVMDHVVRGKVQASLANAFGKRTLDVAIQQKAAIMDEVRASVTQWCAERGITLDYIGYAESLTFNPDVQRAIDTAYVSVKNASAYDARKKMLDVAMIEADINVRNAQANALQKWNGNINLPTFLVMSERLVDWLSNLFGGSAKR